MKFQLFKGLLIATLIITSSFRPKAGIEVISLDMIARTLYQGKSVTGNGTLYYKVNGGLLVTKLDSPLNQVIFTSSTGEYRSYDIAANKVMMMQGADLSSKKSFIYQFLNGQINDLGLRDLGFKLVNTRFEGKIMITEWDAPSDKQIQSQRVEIAFDNYLPIFMGFYDSNKKVIQKTYYTNYQDVAYNKVPFTITEINFISESDSSITRRTYSNLKINGDVSNYWLNYKIPENAEVIVDTKTNSTFSK